MIEWERVSDSEPWERVYYSSVRLKVYGGWLVNTTLGDTGVSDEKLICTSTFVPDAHHFWKLEDNRPVMEYLHESEC